MKFFKRLLSGHDNDNKPAEKAPPKAEKPSTKGNQSPRKKPARAPEPVVVGEDFARLELPDELNRAISELGFTGCTPVQNQVLPHSLDGKDIIAQAQTGTGKTAAFLISIIAYDLENPEVDQRSSGRPFALVIAPTRELVLQIAADAESLTEFTHLRVVPVVGGMDYEKQKKQLDRTVDIVIATPGRLLDFCRSRVIDLSGVECLVIDEADRMLSMGFIPDVKAIISRTPKKHQRQTQLYSATFSEDIKRLAASWTIDPVRIEIEPEQVATDSVEQVVYMVSESDKFKVLSNLVISKTVSRTIVFCNRRDETRTLESKLFQMGFATGLLTGEVNQKKRIKTLDAFKSGEIEVLVATDVAGRGIHVDDVSHVVNYNLPEDPEDYVHRIGRTGRAGNTGVSISLVCESDAFMMPGIEELLGEPMTFSHPPDALLEALPDPVRKARRNEDAPRGKPQQRRRRR